MGTAPLRIHQRPKTSSAGSSPSLVSLRGQRTSSADGRVLPPGLARSTLPRSSIKRAATPQTGASSPAETSVAQLIQQRSLHFRQASRLSPAVLSKPASSTSRYSQDSEQRSPTEEPDLIRSPGLRAEKLDEPIILKGRTLTGWPCPSPTSSLEVNIGDNINDDEGEQTPSAAERLLEMAIKELSPTVETKKSKVARTKEMAPDTISIATAFTKEQPFAPPPSLSSKRSNMPPPLSVDMGSQQSSSDDNMPATPKDIDPLRLVERKDAMASQISITPVSSKARGTGIKKPDIEIGATVLHISASENGWTHGVVVNRAERPIVKRNSKGWFERSLEVALAVQVGRAYYSATTATLSLAPTDSPMFMYNEQVIITRRGLRMHARVVGIRVKKIKGALSYVYSIQPFDGDTHDPVELAETQFHRLPYSVQERHNTMIFCNAACRRVDASTWVHCPASA